MISNLKEKPSCFQKTINLIEKSFNYEPHHSFQNDFYSLVENSNHQNCFIRINEKEEVLAHIGSKSKEIEIEGEIFNITLLGGIAVNENHRGQGYFQELMIDVLAEKKDDSAFFLLWGDLEKLYSKFGFHLCGEQFEIPSGKGKSLFVPTKYHLLTEVDKKRIQFLYSQSFQKFYLTCNRSPRDWENIEKTTSADLFVKKENNQITDYFFMNKGQDLSSVIYEYGSNGDLNLMFKEIKSHGKIWVGKETQGIDQYQFQFFLSPGNTEQFKKFILKLTKNKILIRKIDSIKQKVFFQFNEELLVLGTDEFIKGVFGPGRFEELAGDVPSIFLSGLDSI